MLAKAAEAARLRLLASAGEGAADAARLDTALVTEANAELRAAEAGKAAEALAKGSGGSAFEETVNITQTTSPADCMGAAKTASDVLRVRHFTSYEGIEGIQNSMEIWVSRGEPVGVHVEVGPSFGPAETGAAETGAAARGARGVYVEFDAPGPMVPTYVGPRNTAVIPTTTPLPINNLNPTFVKPPWWQFWKW